MESYLLRLPGELRNKIYEYALTDSTKGVCYREDKCGLGWLCLYPQPLSAIESAGGATKRAQDVKEEDPSRKRCKVTNKQMGRSEKEGTAMVKVDGHIVANQLQFVNQQLRCETKGLAIRYNDILIFDNGVHFMKLMEGLNNHHKSQVQKIVIKTEVGWGTCEGEFDPRLIVPPTTPHHPKFAVHVHFPSARVDKRDAFISAWLLSALYIQYVFRGNTAFVHSLSDSASTQQELANMMKYGNKTVALGPLLAPCVKCFPWDDVFDEAAVRKALLQHHFESTHLIPTLNDGVDALIRVAKDWSENGF